jgi:hypothetical protein
MTRTLAPPPETNVPPAEVKLGTGLDPVSIIPVEPEKPLHVSGTGTLSAGAGTELFATIVVIESGANVTAVDLVVQTLLELQGNASLSPLTGGHIELVPEVNIHFTATSTGTLPVLHLGEIGDDYSVVPSKFEISIEGAPAEAALGQPLVSGRTLTSCDKWKAQVRGLPAGYGAQCKVMDGAGSSRLLAGELIGLFVVKDEPAPADTGLSTAVVVVIVVVVVVVVIGAAIGAFVFLKKKRGDAGSASSASSSISA